MNANKITPNQRKRLHEAAKREIRDLIDESGKLSQKKAYLRAIHCLRFKFYFNKRLRDFVDEMAKQNERTKGLTSDGVFAAVLLQELKDSGIDFFGDYFDDLIEYEEGEYDRNKEKEQGIRNEKALSEKQKKMLNEHKRSFENGKR